jgi:uncharacterized protein YqeY
MDLRGRLESELHAAMREKDEIGRNTIRMVLSSLKLGEVEKGHAFSNDEILGVIQKELKIRSESIEEYSRGGRPDLVEKTRREVAILEKFLPAQMSDEELLAIIAEAIQATDAKLPADMGKVMKIVLPQVQGKAPADRVSRLVRAMLVKE